MLVDTPPLSRAWQRWVAENLIAGVPEEALIDVLVGRGVPEEIARQSVRSPECPCLLEVAREQRNLVEKYERQLENYCRLSALSPDGDRLPYCNSPPRRKFLRDFYAANRAVVLTGMMEASPVLHWTPELLREGFGDQLIEVQTNRRSHPVWDVFLKGKTERMLLRDYVDLVQSAGETNAFYMTGNDGFMSREGSAPLIDQIDFGGEYLESSGTALNAHLWFGPKGAISPMHRDRVNVLKAQVYGRKRVLLAHASELHRMYNRRSFYSEVDPESPDFSRFPLYEDVRVFEVTLHPGECLFIPVGWWHHVRSLDISMSLTFTNFVFPNKFV